MLRPSYSELMEQLNDDMDLDNKITSRYTIVIAAAKRARQIIDGSPCDDSGTITDKAVSIAIHEMNRGDIIITPDDNADAFYKYEEERVSDLNLAQGGLFLADDEVEEDGGDSLFLDKTDADDTDERGLGGFDDEEAELGDLGLDNDLDGDLSGGLDDDII